MLTLRHYSHSYPHSVIIALVFILDHIGFHSTNQAANNTWFSGFYILFQVGRGCEGIILGMMLFSFKENLLVELQMQPSLIAGIVTLHQYDVFILFSFAFKPFIFRVILLGGDYYHFIMARSFHYCM
jgi:hypothetical protein